MQNPELDIQHATLGILDETGELCSAYKKVIGYGKELDRYNILEECGDLLYFMARVQDQKELEVLEDLAAVRMFSTIDPEVSDYKILILLAKSASKIPDYCEINSGDKSYCTQELNYMTYQIYHLLIRVGYSIKEARKLNVDKLRARYPDKWTENKATNRDLGAERTALEGG